jgi:hypothetical protein
VDTLIGETTDHEHQWIISAEVFWTEHGGDIRLVWCEVCDERPGEGEVPVSILQAAIDGQLGQLAGMS